MKNCPHHSQQGPNWHRCKHFPEGLHVTVEAMPCKKCLTHTGGEYPTEPIQIVHIDLFDPTLAPPPKPKPYPRWRVFLLAMWGWARMGFPFPGWKNWNDRRATCKGCPKRVGPMCGECGCFIPLKTLLPAERCPVNLWLPIVDGKPMTGCGCGSGTPSPAE